ncbi:MAG TPA: molybdopterin-dependent oxidoreductase, partial [Pirellula sp.]|nr:molybdopterin-dependent oxidoreductase [Pirellula sp.]
MTIQLSRREALKQTAVSSVGFMTWLSHASRLFSQEAGELVPFLDEPRTPPNRLDWEALDSWLTPQDQVYSVQHYGIPKFELKDFRLEIDGMLKHKKQFTVDELKALPKAEVVMTLECAGNG